jgi:hypothetical protein
MAIDFIGHPTPPNTLVPELERIVQGLDSSYLDLNEAAGSSPEAVLAAFRRARAANAVLFALSSDPLIAAEECAYEAAMATDHIERIRDLVNAEKP